MKSAFWHYRNSRIQLFMLFAILFITDITHAEDQPSKFVFCYENTDLYPAFTGDSDMVPEEKPGFAIDLLNRVGAQAGVKINYIRVPWKRCLALLKAGGVDGIIASFSHSRAEFGSYPMKSGKPDHSRRFLTGDYCLYQLAKRPALWDGKSFTRSQLTVGVPLGYSIVSVLQDMGMKVIEAGNIEGMMALLQRGRVDMVAAPGLSTDALIKRMPDRYSAVKRLDHPLQVKAYYLMLSHQFTKKAPKKTEEIWDAISLLRDKLSAQLLEQY